MVAEHGSESVVEVATVEMLRDWKQEILDAIAVNGETNNTQHES